MGEYDELDEEELEELRQENQELRNEVERLSRINANLIRINKERYNSSERNLPKKMHSGYNLLSSAKREYRYYKGGNHKTVWIFETIFKTPYDISIGYDDAKELINNDVTECDEKNEDIISKLGFNRLYDDYSFVDFYEGSNEKNLIHEMYEEYKEEYHTSYIPDEDQRKIWRYAENWLKQCCYGLDIRMNGVSGQWEMLLHHLEPLADIPAELRFPVKRKKEKQKKEK